MKNRLVTLLVITAFMSSLLVCDGCGTKAVTAKGAVKGFYKALQAGKAKKAVGFLDIKGSLKEIKEKMKEEMKDMPESMRKKAQEKLDEMTVKSVKKDIIEMLEEGFKKDEEKDKSKVKILGVEKGKKGKATVTVKMIDEAGKSSGKHEVEVTKAGAFWKVDAKPYIMLAEMKTMGGMPMMDLDLD